VPLRAGCRPHRRDDATLPRGSFSARGKALERSATINAKQTSTWTHGGSSRGRSGPRSDQPKLSLASSYTRSVRHRCLTLRTSWRRDMFAATCRGKVRRCLSPCGHSMSSQTASRCEGSTRSSCASTTRRGEARRHLPFVPSRQVTAESHLARWRRPDHRPPRGHRFGVQQIQAPHRGRTV